MSKMKIMPSEKMETKDKLPIKIDGQLLTTKKLEP
jgi:hypothetical protein